MDVKELMSPEEEKTPLSSEDQQLFDGFSFTAEDKDINAIDRWEKHREQTSGAWNMYNCS